LPKLVDLFKSLDVNLPLSTKFLLFIAEVMKNYGPIIFAALIILSVLLKIFISLPKVKPHWHKLILSLPVIGVFLQNVEMANFSRNFGIMLKSGLPISTALESQHKSTTNLIFKGYIGKIIKGVDKGQSMEEVLQQARFKFFPAIAVKMIGVGEKTGKLDESLIYLGDFFEDEVDNTAKNFSTILEPVILIGVGLLVAFVALAIISPIYELTGSIRK
jgi:type II secretory pathway component PulF